MEGNDVTLDVRGLPPPEPMMRVFDALDVLPRGQRLRMLIHCEPIPLYGMLLEDGYDYQIETEGDPYYEILIWHKD